DGTVINNATIFSGARLYVSSGNSVDITNVEIKDGGYIDVDNGLWDVKIAGRHEIYGDFYVSNGYTSNFVVSSGDWFYINSGTLAEKTNATDGNMIIRSGGSAYNTNICKSGYMRIDSGGTANSTTMSGGVMNISNGGIANSTTINSGGEMYISSGGIANGTTVNIGGSIFISQGGCVTVLTVLAGGILNNFSFAENKYLKNITDGSAFIASNVYIVDSCMYISSDGVANGAIVNDGGDMHISSSGVANSTTVNSNACMYIANGGVANSTILVGGCLSISNGGIANNTVVTSSDITSASGRGGIMNISSGGIANSATINKGGMYIRGEGTANKATVNGGFMGIYNGGMANGTVVNSGALYISKGGTANSTTISGGFMKITSGGAHCGSLQIASEAIVSAYFGSVIDFTVSNRKAADGYLINDLSLISGAPTYTITVSANQAAGIYKLAQGAENFTGTLSIGTDSINYGAITVNGDDLVCEGNSYSLDNVSGNLTLTITSSDVTPPEKPVASANITTKTNQNVVVTATFSSDTTVKQYSFNNKTWHTYTNGGVIMIVNGSIYFRGMDAAGNISEVTTYTVRNIDKTVPLLNGVPTATVDGQSVTISWSAASDNVGVAGYYLTIGENTYEVTGTSYTVELSAGTYSYSISAYDVAGNESSTSASQSFTIAELVSTVKANANSVEWNIEEDYFTAELGRTDVEGSLVLDNITEKSISTYGMPTGSYQWSISAGNDKGISNSFVATAFGKTEIFSAEDDGSFDLFFGNAKGTWEDGYSAEHTGSADVWLGTGDKVYLTGKNKIADIFVGSDDANVLVLTDDSNGDALFVDDVFTALPDSLTEQQARFEQIDEIRAGAGDDVIDMTSSKFAYVGDGVKIYGGLGNDTIWANNGENTLFGDAGNDRIVGGSDNDVIVGGIGNDRLHGGGGVDTFCFGENWGRDTVEQLADGEVILWFENGSMDNWDAAKLTYTDGTNTVRVTGVSADKITLKFGDDDSVRYDELAESGCFEDSMSEKIFEDKNNGYLA
ncbi:MAG: AIDA repeat-containing protein, partial [Lentisphaeria bacterium]|nr:AIDA repeat-containing protein [Lentisphaeria bacterium]